MTEQEIITVVKAHAEGKKIEMIGENTNGCWLECAKPVWDFSKNTYRVKAIKKLSYKWRSLLEESPDSNTSLLFCTIRNRNVHYGYYDAVERRFYLGNSDDVYESGGMTNRHSVPYLEVKAWTYLPNCPNNK